MPQASICPGSSLSITTSTWRASRARSSRPSSWWEQAGDGALRRLDPYHLGPELGQDGGGEERGEVAAGAIQHPEVVQGLGLFVHALRIAELLGVLRPRDDGLVDMSVGVAHIRVLPSHSAGGLAPFRSAH